MGKGYDYSLGEARLLAAKQSDPYLREMMTWLCNKVEMLLKADNERSQGKPEGKPKSELTAHQALLLLTILHDGRIPSRTAKCLYDQVGDGEERRMLEKAHDCLYEIASPAMPDYYGNFGGCWPS